MIYAGNKYNNLLLMISFPDFFEKVPMAILFTINGKIVNCNPAFVETFTYSFNEIIDRPIVDIISMGHHEHAKLTIKEEDNEAGAWPDKFFGILKGPEKEIEVEVSRIPAKPHESCFLINPVLTSKVAIQQERNNGHTLSIITEEESKKDIQAYIEAMQMAKLAFWQFDIQNDMVELSEEYGKLIGEHWKGSKKMKLKEYVDDYVHPLDRDKVLTPWGAVENGSYPPTENSVEFRVLKKDGSIIYVLNVLRMKFKDGVKVSCEGIVQDITLLRKAEAKVQEQHDNLEKIIAQRTKELKKSEEKLYDALKLGKLTTWEFNFKTKKYSGGGAIGDILGPIERVGPYNEVEVAAYEKMIHPDDLPIYVGSFQKALKSKDSRYLDYVTYRIIKPDGEIRYLYLSIKGEMEKNGRFSKLYGTIQDITDFKKVEEEKEKLNAIVEITPDIVAVVGSNGNLIYLNQSGRFFYGFLERKSIENINFFDLQEEETKSFLKDTGFAMASSQGVWTGESELRGKNNQTVPVSLVIVAHFEQGGIINSYSLIIRNISTQKKTEQDLLYKNAELDTFVYRASHDLRGPISSLLGLYQIVQYEIKEEKALQFFEMFNKQIRRLNEIILALINLTKIKESSVSNLPINFNEIVNDAIDSLRHLTDFSNIEFNVKINVKREFRSDKSMITTIIQNLIENAIKYSKTTGSAPINVAIEATRTVLSIKVEDKGIGIDKDVQGRIFDMFFRGHEISKGSGLGLYILKNTVEKLKGKVSLESQVGVGTTFIIELPYIDE